METWFLVLLLLLGLPGPLGAGTPTNNSTDPVTEGLHFSEATAELRSTGNGAASSSYSSESLSPSQRNLLLTHSAGTHAATAATFEIEQTKVFTETSSRSPEVTNLSTEPFSASGAAAEAGGGSSDGSSSSSSSSSTDWKDFTNTNQMPVITHTMSPEDSSFLFTEVENLPQDSPDTTLRLGDATALVSQTAVLTDRTYTTTISRAGERTLLSVTSSSNNSTSSAFTEDSNSHQPPSTWGIPPRSAETENYTQSAPSTRTNGGETTQHTTGAFPETGSPGTPGLTEHPNATKHQHSPTAQETPDSTPSLGVTELSTDQSEVSVSSTPPFTSHVGGSVNSSGTDQGSSSSGGMSSETTTGAQNQEGTQGLSPQTSEGSPGLGLTAAPSTVSSSTSEMKDSSTGEPVLSTKVSLTTESVPVTKRSQTTEENTSEATAFPTTTMASTLHPLPSTSLTILSSTSSGYSSEAPTEATLPYTTPTSTVSTLAPLTSAAHPTDHVSPSQGPSTGTANPTEAAAVTTETSAATQRATTAPVFLRTTSTHSTPAGSTETLHVTSKHSELEATTPPTDIQTAKVPPRNPCVSNPCMNGGICTSYEGPEYTCRCKQAWTGPNCDQDMNECEKDPCPAGSKCVNTRGSFSCECPLGFDLEDGRTCTRAKTFLGTFSFDKQDSSIKSAAMHEIQREILQLLNVSLSVLRGYSRSTLSKKEQGGLHILAVSTFSISTDVTTAEVYESITVSLRKCNSSLSHCRMVLLHRLSYHTESLCEAQSTQCDPERSACNDSSGTSSCQCLLGYYKRSPEEMSCLECGDGYKLENGTCVPCMFGFGGFNCGNFYKLIAVVVSPAGGALLLILIIALIVTCCKKNKNDINKIIFKSGDMQMSPYADFPKNSRISMEWGRETIEMQENGSTKNLLQMTDIYYSPALRNADLERNGLYPFTGLPGSRHSCIYPAQWNPSFLSDDSRRRDYF
ncbi:protein HEG isoform X2 [Kryptolebias marmoratus]|uniref:protein HEG isoform X2 n=1 Tax=Kryptolebias marmoratus TaxID=37003 RepID=UPI0007F865E5|nr:protein HEG isoform X2 [Kryptolebias marmoratus]